MQWQTITFDTLDSTNLEAKRMIQSQASAQSLHGTIITAESQTGGKGRLGRAWESPKSTGLWFTAIIEPRTSLSEASLYSFAAALSVAEAISQTTNLEPKLKWPNDVLLNGRKLCGILLELIPYSKTAYYLAIGIGINVYQAKEDFPPELQEKAISLAMASNQHVDRMTLLDAILEQLQKNCTLLETQGFAPVREQWIAQSAIIGREVSVQQHGIPLYTGIAEDIAIDGSLLVRTVDGLQTVTAADVSLRSQDGNYSF
jgi:BirA family biotin operon repressor/biotin-[acetyl-CoA-carboxylase] ligase